MLFNPEFYDRVSSKVSPCYQLFGIASSQSDLLYHSALKREPLSLLTLQDKREYENGTKLLRIEVRLRAGSHEHPIKNFSIPYQDEPTEREASLLRETAERYISKVKNRARKMGVRGVISVDRTWEGVHESLVVESR